MYIVPLGTSAQHCSGTYEFIPCPVAATSSTAAVIDAQHEPWAFAEKPAFGPFVTWMTWVCMSSARVTWLLPTKQRAFRCCTHSRQSCLRLRWELHEYKTCRTGPKINESIWVPGQYCMCPTLLLTREMQVTRGCTSNTCPEHDLTITRRQNQPEYPKIIALILLTDDGNIEKMKKLSLAENQNHFNTIYTINWTPLGKNTVIHSTVVWVWYRVHSLSCDD